MKIPAAALSTIAVLSLAGSASAALRQFTASLNGANERPTPVVSGGSAGCNITLDDVTGNTTINCNFAGLTSNANNAHIHGLADQNTAAGVILGMTFTPATAGTAQATGLLASGLFTTQQLISGMINGQTYVNIHSVNFPSGEIRGQIVPVTAIPAVQPWLLVVLGVGLAGVGVLAMTRKRFARG